MLQFLYFILPKVLKKIKMIIVKSFFKSVGKNFVFCPSDSFSYNTISVGDDVYIGPGAKFSASNSFISIGNKIMFGPNVTIMGGDHNTSQIGSYMYDVKNKLPENDLPVILEDDIWVGCCVTILKGVSIGTGSIIAAGSVVTKSIPANSVVAGVPAKVIKNRFTDIELLEHKKRLGIN